MKNNLGSFEALVLLSILRLRDDAYGAAIQRDIAARTGREPAFGALYTTLDRMVQKGLVRARIGPPTAIRGGRRKKLYQFDAAGGAALSEAWDTWRKMTEGLDAQLEDLRVESMEGVRDV